MNPRIVFMGTPEFAVPTLEALVGKFGYGDGGVVGVVTVPDRKKGRGQKLAYSPVKEKALELGYEEGKNLLQPGSLKDERFIEALNSMQPDIFCVLAFRILPESVFSIPKIASFNIHGSLLPKYRGAAPINRAIMNGEKETGLTTFILQKKVDTGNIIEKVTVDITENMTAGELHDRMMPLAADISLTTTEKLSSGKYELKSQDDTLATPAPKIFRDDCRIDFNKSASEIHNHIRGLSPYPGAWTVFNGKTLKILRAEVYPSDESLKPSEFKIQDDKFLVGTGSANISVSLLKVQLEGKKSTDVISFIRGYRGDNKGIIN